MSRTMAFLLLVAAAAPAVAAGLETRTLFSGGGATQVAARGDAYFVVDGQGSVFTGPVFQAAQGPAQRIDDGRPTRMMAASEEAVFRLRADGTVATLSGAGWTEAPAAGLLHHTFAKIGSGVWKTYFLSDAGEIWRVSSSRWGETETLGELRPTFDSERVQDFCVTSFTCYALTGERHLLAIQTPTFPTHRGRVTGQVELDFDATGLCANDTGVFLLSTAGDIRHWTFGRVDVIPGSGGARQIDCDGDFLYALMADGAVRRFSLQARTWEEVYRGRATRCIKVHRASHSLSASTALLIVTGDGDLVGLSTCFEGAPDRASITRARNFSALYPTSREVGQ